MRIKPRNLDIVKSSRYTGLAMGQRDRKRTRMAVRQKKDAYHHGDLRRVLIDAAAKLAAKNGVAGVTIRKVVGKAGVSHAAPYHYFPSREALLAAVAEEGFCRFDAAQEEALRSAGPNPRDQLHALGISYVRFAVRNPYYFRVMFRPEFRKLEAYSALAEISSRTFDRLVNTVRASTRSGVPDTDPVLPSILAWSAVHGLASLWLDGPLTTRTPAGSRFETIAHWIVTAITDAITFKGQSRGRYKHPSSD